LLYSAYCTPGGQPCGPRLTGSLGDGKPVPRAIAHSAYRKHHWHFDEDSIEARWATAVSAGGGPTAFAYNAQRNGGLQGATGATDNDATALHLDNVIFDPADNPMMLVRWRAPAAVTGFSFEIGFTDAKTDEFLPGITDIDTPASGNGITDGGGIHMDTDQTLTTAAAWGVGTSTTILKTDMLTFTPTASAIQYTMVGVREGLTYVAHWNAGALVGNRIWAVASGPDAAILVRPSLVFRTRNTTSKTINIHSIVLAAEENAT